jgi:hypothetical protein
MHVDFTRKRVIFTSKRVTLCVYKFFECVDLLNWILRAQIILVPAVITLNRVKITLMRKSLLWVSKAHSEFINHTHACSNHTKIMNFTLNRVISTRLRMARIYLFIYIFINLLKINRDELQLIFTFYLR